MFIPPNRKRNIQVTFRCTKEEVDIIAKKARTAGMSRTEYLIRSLHDEQIRIYPGLLDVMSELKRQGINLNTALRYAHHNSEYSADLHTAIRNCNALYALCFEKWIEITTLPDFQSDLDADGSRDDSGSDV